MDYAWGLPAHRVGRNGQRQGGSESVHRAACGLAVEGCEEMLVTGKAVRLAGGVDADADPHNHVCASLLCQQCVHEPGCAVLVSGDGLTGAAAAGAADLPLVISAALIVRYRQGTCGCDTHKPWQACFTVWWHARGPGSCV